MYYVEAFCVTEIDFQKWECEDKCLRKTYSVKAEGDYGKCFSKENFVVTKKVFRRRFMY